MKPTAAPPSAPRHTSALLLVLALSLTACATPSPPQAGQVRLPARPALTEPIPPVSYSELVRRSLSSWAEQLTPTPPTR